MAVKFLVIFDFWMEWLYLFWVSMWYDAFHQVSVEEYNYLGWEKLFENLRRLFSAWPSLVSEWNERSISKSLFGLSHPIKFLLIRTYSLEEEVVWRIPRWLFSWWTSLISGWNDLSKSWSPFCLEDSHQKRKYGFDTHLPFLKMLFEEFQDGYLVHGHLWYLNGKILAILSLNRALSFEDVVWRIPWKLLSAWPSLVSECNELSIWLNWLMPTIKALPERTYGLEDVVWRNSR